MAVKFTPRVGRQRVSKSLHPSIAGTNKSAKEAMAIVQKNFLDLVSQFRGVTPSVLEEVLRPTFDKALTYTPVDTGDLKASGYLETSGGKRNPEAAIGFGRGGNPTYATLVHERTDINHQAPTRAKFLQSAIEEDMDSFQVRFMNALSSRISLK